MIWALVLLGVSGFVSATILPGNSEAAFLLYLANYPNFWFIALMVVTLTNTLGSVTSFLITYLIPHKEPSSKVLDYVRRYGSPVLFFSFLPVVGDALPLAAGWLRLSPMRCVLFIGAGKFVRYCFILMGFRVAIGG